MSNDSKNQNGLTSIYSEYFSDDNCKGQIWCAYSTQNDKATPYIFLTSSPLINYKPKDSIAFRFSLLQASNLAAALEEIAGKPENFKNGYQAAQSSDQKKSLIIQTGTLTETKATGIALIFKNESQERVVTLSPIETFGLAKFILSDILAALIQEFSNAHAAPVHTKPKGPMNSGGTITFE
ncbi:MAG: hypothetical protein ABIK12_17150 [Pseudomonadota bacterium]